MFRQPKSSATSLTRDDLVDLYLRIRPSIEQVLARRTGSLTLAADLAQEIFFKIDTITAALPTRVDGERYFLRVAMNAAFDYKKIEARRQALLQEDAAYSMPPVQPSPEYGALARDELRFIETALAELPEKCRSAFVMSRVEGLSHAEIAADLGVSRSLVEKYVARALLHCRKRLAK